MKSAAPVRAPPPARTFRNTNRVNRIRHHLRLYAQTILSSLGRVPVKELIRTQFPFWLRDSPTPPMLSVELTNRCNLRCGYCTNPTTLRPRGMMSEATFCRLVEEAPRGRRLPRGALRERRADSASSIRRLHREALLRRTLGVSDDELATHQRRHQQSRRCKVHGRSM